MSWCRHRKKAKSKEAASEVKKRERVEAKLVKERKKNKRFGMRLYRSMKRIGRLLAKGKESKAEVKELRKSQRHGIQRQRKGKGRRAHLTLAAKSLTIDGLSSANMSGARWKNLCASFGRNLVLGEDVDLKGASDRTCRRLMSEHDMVCLAHEIEELTKQAKNGNLQFMCDISPLLGSKQSHNHTHIPCLIFPSYTTYNISLTILKLSCRGISCL